jgi:hypothetical protein
MLIALQRLPPQIWSITHYRKSISKKAIIIQYDRLYSGLNKTTTVNSNPTLIVGEEWRNWFDMQQLET